MAYQVEVTDTFGGEANYCWVRRYRIEGEGKTQRQLVREAKKFAGWTGLRCNVYCCGTDLIDIRPRNIHQVAFVSWIDE